MPMQKVIIPKGLINPRETTIIEIPMDLQGKPTVIAKPKDGRPLHSTMVEGDTSMNYSGFGNISGISSGSSPRRSPGAVSGGEGGLNYSEEYYAIFGSNPPYYAPLAPLPTPPPASPQFAAGGYSNYQSYGGGGGGGSCPGSYSGNQANSSSKEWYNWQAPDQFSSFRDPNETFQRRKAKCEMTFPGRTKMPFDRDYRSVGAEPLPYEHSSTSSRGCAMSCSMSTTGAAAANWQRPEFPSTFRDPYSTMQKRKAKMEGTFPGRTAMPFEVDFRSLPLGAGGGSAGGTSIGGGSCPGNRRPADVSSYCGGAGSFGMSGVGLAKDIINTIAPAALGSTMPSTPSGSPPAAVLKSSLPTAQDWDVIGPFEPGLASTPKPHKYTKGVDYEERFFPYITSTPNPQNAWQPSYGEEVCAGGCGSGGGGGFDAFGGTSMQRSMASMSSPEKEIENVLDMWEQTEAEKIQDDLERFQKARRRLIFDATGMGDADEM